MIDCQISITITIAFARKNSLKSLPFGQQQLSKDFNMCEPSKGLSKDFSVGESSKGLKI